MAAGSAAAPALCVGSDINTGVFGPAADTWAVATNGSERLRVTSTGAVGIGTTAPANKFNVVQYDSFSGDLISGLFQASKTTVSDAGVAIGSTNGNAPFIAATKLNNGTGTATSLSIKTDATDRIIVGSSGDVGIGVSPAAGTRLHIQGADTTATANSLFVQNSAATKTFQVRNDGLVNTGVAALSPYNLTTGSAVNMVVASDGNVYRSTSALKYKTNVEDATHGLAQVLQLRPVTYKGKNDGEIIFGGLIAEEVDAVGLTEFVQYADDGSPDALAYGNMVSLAFKAIQELNAKVEALEARVAALEA
jgi:hypothetical protein